MAVYSKKKAKEQRSALASLKGRLKERQVKCDKDSAPENLNDFEIIQTI